MSEQGEKLSYNRWIDWDGISMVWHRDLVRFMRQRTRMYGGVFRSVIWLFAFGFGLRRSFVSVEGYDYMQFVFPGIIAMSIIFSAVQSAISIVRDREFGFLKEILVAPVPRASIVIGKALGGATTSTFQGAILLLLAPVAGVHISLFAAFLSLLAMFLTALCLSSLGILIAARLADFESFGSLQNFITMPMFLLSGAMFPVVNLPVWFHYIILANPLSYGVDIIRGTLIGLHNYSYYIDCGVLIIYTFMMLSCAVFLFEREG
ncbi:ABC transporter permease [Desulfolucanica intricata]|uniref:ABC transporter permease n=1 Tax=Desulfolucanica intricata TaxID=1285191 RepID=UPI0008320520|nr:ABC transporter permease [Desulfolucanica intricata]